MVAELHYLVQRQLKDVHDRLTLNGDSGGIDENQVVDTAAVAQGYLGSDPAADRTAHDDNIMQIKLLKERHIALGQCAHAVQPIGAGSATETAVDRDKYCPTGQVWDRIADKYTVLVIVFLQDRPRRFSELQRMITGISQKVLTQTLRSLERDGLLTRTVYAEVPPRVEYALTPLGETLIEPLAALREWAEANIEAIVVAQQDYDQG